MRFHPARPTPRRFVEALRAAGSDADFDEYVYAGGVLLDGRTWTLGNPADQYESREAPLPEVLEIYVYESSTEALLPDTRWNRPYTNENTAGRLRGCNADEAADAIVAADAGDYSHFTCDDGGEMPPLLAARPVEGTLTAGLAPMFGPSARAYLRAVRALLPDGPAGRATDMRQAWRTGGCPACGAPAGDDGIDLAADGSPAHVTISGVVALCAGAFTLDPVPPGISYRPWLYYPAGEDIEL